MTPDGLHKDSTRAAITEEEEEEEEEKNMSCTLERLLASQDLPEDNAEGIHIGLFVEDLPRHHLWCHPQGRALRTLHAITEVLSPLFDLLHASKVAQKRGRRQTRRARARRKGEGGVRTLRPKSHNLML